MAKKNVQTKKPVPSREKTGLSEEDVRRDITRSETFFSVYANDVQLQTSAWDVRLILGEIGDALKEGSVPVLKLKQIGEVRISPQLAKRLTIILIQQLKHYEENVGPIPLISE